ncbi:flagellar hook protein FlgE [Geopseudomonas sagittaria]|uniref:Flagellar hook protein FlgE n=1 Tax=Geopseudomonas sagittaria TaxID=1135990 RepID=A0A1I5QCE4_9GAMM|nr:flagellar hook protein FlgE [Pseudomonas sagittaria]MCM2330093.1 flagellar hook protein FlgE [Pseudomonas sagittaria]SFP43978.1 flagellar hook protein FlgE [Pseudomonas sagittaria]
MGFSQALSGLNAASKNLDVMGNNIANAQTVGYKSASMQFADVYAGAKVGLGVSVAAIQQNFKDGNLEATGRNLDLAISGGGFLRFDQGEQIIYARNGQLTMTPDGFLENAQGGRLTGYPGAAGSGGQLQQLNVSAAGLPAKATGEVKATMNLNAGMATLDPAAFDPLKPATYSYANGATVFDSQGTAQTLTLYFIKTGVNTWEVKAGRSTPEGQQFSETDIPLAFDSNGLLVAGYEPGNVTFALDNGANNLDFKLNLTGSTQFANEFELGSLTQDGYTSGSLTGISVDKKGQVIGNYSNERTLVLGTIAMANFRNPEGLTPVGGGWVETADSGQVLIGEAGTGLFGSVEAGVIETSNVDLTKELVNLIIAQRNFQANAQTIKLQDEVLQQAVNLR